MQSFKDAGGEDIFSEAQEDKKSEEEDKNSGSECDEQEDNEEDENDYDDLDLDLQDEEPQNDTCCAKLSKKIEEWLMIPPTNVRLKTFHYFISLCFYSDIFLTSMCIASYNFRNKIE